MFCGRWYRSTPLYLETPADGCRHPGGGWASSELLTMLPAGIQGKLATEPAACRRMARRPVDPRRDPRQAPAECLRALRDAHGLPRLRR